MQPKSFIIREQTLKRLIVTIVFPFLLIACDCMVYDEMANCPRGVYIHPYAQTECQTSPMYPSVVNEFYIYAFDSEDKFIGELYVDNVALSADYEVLFPLKDPGTYTFVVWSGIDKNSFNSINPVVAITTKNDLLHELKNKNLKTSDLKNKTIFVGSSRKATVGRDRELYSKTTINLREITNRINVKVEGLNESEKLIVRLASDNKSYAVDGNIIKSTQVEYPGTITYPSREELVADFTTLKLETGRMSILEVLDRVTGEVLYSGDLIGSILLSPLSKDVNLRCDNDFNILLKVRKCKACKTGYEVFEIYVNEWLVHSYDVVL